MRRKIQRQIEQIAQETFGYDRLRSGQEVIQAVIDGHDALAVMPTGSGKSAIYQIAALQLPGATVAISPPIALQQDQLEAIEQQHIAAAAAATLAQERRQQFERSRLEMMRGYAELQGCRRQYLLNYFGESLDEPCGFCGNCKAGIIIESNSNLPFPINSIVIHTNFGKGRVLRYEGDKIVILFETVGYKTFALELVQGLLKQLDEGLEALRLGARTGFSD